MAQFGNGRLHIRTLEPVASLGQTIAQELCYLNFAMGSNPQNAPARCRSNSDGTIQTAREGISGIVHNINITFEFSDWLHMGFFHDELIQTSSMSFSPVRYTTIPTSGVITDPDITDDNAADIRVHLRRQHESGQAGFFTNVTTAPAERLQVQVDGANNTLTFDTALAGGEIAYFVPQTYSQIETVGHEAEFENYGDLEMYLTSFGRDDYKRGLVYHFSKIIRVEVPPTVDFTQSPQTITVPFTATAENGRNFPYELINPEGAVWLLNLAFSF